MIIGKSPSQQGINALMIEMFVPNEANIETLMSAVDQGYLVQVTSMLKSV